MKEYGLIEGLGGRRQVESELIEDRRIDGIAIGSSVDVSESMSTVVVGLKFIAWWGQARKVARANAALGRHGKIIHAI